jgi:5-aminopentanamidase
MKISLIQYCPQHSAADKNRKYIIDKCTSIVSDIVVFPELSVSGYYFTNKEALLPYSDKIDSEFFSKIQAISTKQNKIICLGFAENTDNNIFNSCICIFPKSEYNAVYRKSHLFYKERFAFEQSNRGYFVINYPDFDIKIGLMICYDWRFPESARTLGLKGADLILCPSNLVTPIWDRVMPARAIENKVYVAVANRIGIEKTEDNQLLFTGKSAVYSYNGDILALAKSDTEEVISCELFPEQTRNKSFNEFNDIFKDRRPELYL